MTLKIPIDRAEVVYLAERGQDTEDMAAHFQVSVRHMRRVMKEYGVNRNVGRARIPLDEETMKTVYESIANKTTSIDMAALFLGISTRTLRRRIKEYATYTQSTGRSRQGTSLREHSDGRLTFLAGRSRGNGEDDDSD